MLIRNNAICITERRRSMRYVIGQWTSVIGMLLTVLSFQMKTRKQIIIFQTLGSTFFLASYFLLGSWTGVYMNIVYLSRNIVFYCSKEKAWAQKKSWLYIFLGASALAGLLGYQSIIDVLPICGAVFATTAMYMQNENKLRLLNLAASPCWLIYNINLSSSGGVICEVFNIVSIIVGLIRYRECSLFRQGNERIAVKDAKENIAG